MRARILYHGNCFDGAASAALVGRFLRDREGAKLERLEQQPLQYHEGDPFPADAFSADLNAVVDFRWSPSPRLDWWFDHHRSAFQRPEWREAFERERREHHFWDPSAPSCCGFAARVLREQFGWSASDLGELVRWADIIDAARFPSASAAVKLEEPALRIMALLEATRDPAVPDRLIEAMRTRPLAAIAEEPWVRQPLGPILDRHWRSVEAVRRLAREQGGVVAVDLTEASIEALNKFICYHLFPDARYAVAVTRDAKRAKVSVGFNPWARERREHDISKICERYGGGGHPVVGAVSLDAGRVAEARRIAGEIAAVLRGPPAP